MIVQALFDWENNKVVIVTLRALFIKKIKIKNKIPS